MRAIDQEGVQVRGLTVASLQEERRPPPSTMGRGFPRECFWSWHRQVATGIGGPSTSQHHMYTGLSGVCLPYHCLQFPGRQDSRCQTDSAR